MTGRKKEYKFQRFRFPSNIQTHIHPTKGREKESTSKGRKRARFLSGRILYNYHLNDNKTFLLTNGISNSRSGLFPH